jgi:hypothetical protein
VLPNKSCSLEQSQGSAIISSSSQRANVGEELGSAQREALLHWNIAYRKRCAANRARSPSLSGYLNYQKGRWAQRLMRRDPRCRALLAVLWRQLGMEAVEVLFARPLLTLDRAGLSEITGSGFWRNVLLPLDQPGDLPPFFDTSFYFENRGFELEGLAPLAHYVLVGASEGRNPHPLFNTGWYLSRNPDVVASGVNPLFHFVTVGGPEGRSPHPLVSGSWYRSKFEGRRQAEIAARSAPVPMAERHYVIHDVTTASASDVARAPKPPVICVSHVLPSQPRAGNEYRISKVLEWLARRGHQLILVVAPPENEEPDQARRKIFFDKYPNAVICCRDGTVFASAGMLGRSLALLNGRRVGTVVGKEPATRGEGPLTAPERTFCHDALLGVLLAVARQFPQAVHYINYAFMTRFLPYLSPAPKSFVDTHDVLSEKAAKVGAFGIADGATVSFEQERQMLERGGALLAIHREDAAKLAALVPDKPVLTATVDFAAPDVGARPDRPTILVVANNNAPNLKGVRDFLRFAWPAVKSGRPDAELVVVGSVAQSLRYPDPQVRFAGIVDDLAPCYRDARVVINPAVAGTGLKIKTVESIAYSRPIVSFPNGVDGIPAPLRDLCHVVSDWYEFSQKVIALLELDGGSALSSGERAAIRHELEPGTVYQELDAWLAQFDLAATS